MLYHDNISLLSLVKNLFILETKAHSIVGFLGLPLLMPKLTLGNSLCECTAGGFLEMAHSALG